jgi:hypothetical protein
VATQKKPPNCLGGFERFRLAGTDTVFAVISSTFFPACRAPGKGAMLPTSPRIARVKSRIACGPLVML